MTCRICLEDGDLISPCNCTGTAAYVHEECLVKWLNTSGRSDCEICKYEYVFEQVEQRKCVVCPEWSCGRDTCFWFAFLFVTVPLVSFMTGLDCENMFFACNLYFWCIVTYSREEPHVVENSVFWRFGLCAGQFVVAFRYNMWFYFEVETILLNCFFIFVYVYLCCNQSKQVVQYIYTGEDT
jgi:hypothetical protein